MRLTETSQFRLIIPEPFDFQLTVAKPAGWHWSTIKEVFKNGTLWSGVYLKDNPIGLKMSGTKRTVTVTIYSKSALMPREVNALKAVVRSGLGADEDLAGFYQFAKSDPVLSVTVKDLYGMRVGRLDDVFGRVILAILLQMAPLARSNQMMTTLLEHYGIKITFDRKEVTLGPRPRDISRLAPEELKVKAKLGYRAERLVQAAQFLTKHPLSLNELSALPEDIALKELMEIPGVGEYSAGIILGQTSVPIDVWSVVIMSELLTARTPQNPRQEINTVTTKLKERWGRWGWIAFVYVLNDLENLAKTFKLSRLH